MHHYIPWKDLTNAGHPLDDWFIIWMDPPMKLITSIEWIKYIVINISHPMYEDENIHPSHVIQMIHRHKD
jgi:hypothetical protein